MSAPRTRATRRQRGVAAIELALILPILLTMLAFPLFYARVFWHYTVAEKAAHDGARYLSSVSLVDMTTPSKAGYALEVARAIAAAEISDLNPGPYAADITAQCNGANCAGLLPPTTVTLIVQVAVYDIFFPDVTADAVGDNGFPLFAQVTMPYVGK